MTPRVVPKAKISAPAREYERARRQALDATLEKHNLPRVEREPNRRYGPGSEHSWFADTAAVAMVDAGAIPPIVAGGVDGARRRLEVERRDLSSAATAGGGFLAPSYIAADFALSVKSKAVLAGAMRTEPLPPRGGMTLEIPRLTGAASVTAAAENATVAEQDPSTTTQATGTVVLLSGLVDVSEQLFDRSDPPADQWLAEELGGLIGAATDLKVVADLIALSGTTSITSTTTTAAANYAAAGALVGAVGEAFGAPSSDQLLVMHPRRAAYITTKLGFSVVWPARLVETPAVPTTVSTNQDEMLAFARSEVILFLGPPRFRAMADVGSGTLTWRIVADRYVAVVVRQPTAVAKATGAGLITPPYVA